MVASGVASKGLDFSEIQHVIIFTMPKEIEDYVHQIGRTGRSGKTGIATAFVNMNTPEETLLDLKYLLMEAGQKCALSWLFFLLLTVFQGSSVSTISRRPKSGTRRYRQKLPSLRWPWAWHRELSQAGRHTSPPDGCSAHQRWRWWLLVMYSCAVNVAIFPVNLLDQREARGCRNRFSAPSLQRLSE